MGFLAHISDLHFGSADPALILALLADLRQARPDLIVISGDITQRAFVREFEQARGFLQLLPCPYLVVPGNHDVPGRNLIERLLRPFDRYRRFIAADLCPVHRGTDFVVAGINSVRPFRFGWDWSRGRISPRQLHRLEQVFGAEPGSRVRVVAVHHPFLLSRETQHRGRAGGFGRALACFRRLEIRLVLTGHLHKALSGETDGDATKHPLIAVQAGTAVSTRTVYEPNTYNWICVERRKLRVVVRSWNGAAFIRRSVRQYDLG